MRDRDFPVDFNDVRAGRVTALRAHQESRCHVAPDMMVVVGDDAGNRALARVVVVDAGTVTLLIVRAVTPAPASTGGAG